MIRRDVLDMAEPIRKNARVNHKLWLTTMAVCGKLLFAVVKGEVWRGVRVV